MRECFFKKRRGSGFFFIKNRREEGVEKGEEGLKKEREVLKKGEVV